MRVLFLLKLLSLLLHSFSFLMWHIASVTVKTHLKPPKLHHQWITTGYHSDEWGQQYPCSQKDAEECFSRPHTPPPHNTKHTACLHKRSSIKITYRWPTGPVDAETVLCCQRDWLIKNDDIILEPASKWDGHKNRSRASNACLLLSVKNKDISGLKIPQNWSVVVPLAACRNPTFSQRIKQDTFLNSLNPPQNFLLLCYLG